MSYISQIVPLELKVSDEKKKGFLGSVIVIIGISLTSLSSGDVYYWPETNRDYVHKVCVEVTYLVCSCAENCKNTRSTPYGVRHLGLSTPYLPHAFESSG